MSLNGHKIANEKDPILREVYGMGYDVLIEEYWNNKIVLIDNINNIKKEIKMYDWQKTIAKLNFCNGLMPDGTAHRWIKEGDGSAEIFRNLIKPE